MKSFQFFVQDDRYSVPTLVLADLSTEGRARVRATELLLQSPHHLSVEVCTTEKPIFTVKPERRQPPGSPCPSAG